MHALKALSLISVVKRGTMKLVILVPEKQSSLISSIPSWRWIWFNFEQDSNNEIGNDVTLESFSNIAFVMELSLKQYSPRTESDEGNLISCKLVHDEKA